MFKTDRTNAGDAFDMLKAVRLHSRITIDHEKQPETDSYEPSFCHITPDMLRCKLVLFFGGAA